MNRVQKLFQTGLAALVLLSSLSCATNGAEKLSYKTQNEAAQALADKGGARQLITDPGHIPRFKSLKKKMAPGHLFYLSHPSDEKLKGRYRADFKGVLRLPYRVRIKVNGLTFSELRDKVMAAYAKFFQRGVGNVDFKLLRRDYLVEVRGFVKDSGRYYVSRNEGLDKVVDKAGGLRGDLSENFYKAVISQQGNNYAVSLNQFYQNSAAANSFVWTGGDKVFVTDLQESEMSAALPIVTVLSGVREPKKTLYRKGADVFYYIGKSGGAIDNLDYEESYIFRRNNGKLEKIQFLLTDTGSIPALRPNDILLLQSQKPSAADKVMERLVQVATIITSIGLLLLL